MSLLKLVLVGYFNHVWLTVYAARSLAVRMGAPSPGVGAAFARQGDFTSSLLPRESFLIEQRTYFLQNNSFLLGLGPPPLFCPFWDLSGDLVQRVLFLFFFSFLFFFLFTTKRRSIRIKMEKQSKKNKKPEARLGGEWACHVLIFHCCGELYIHNHLIAVGVRERLWCHLHKSC